MLVPKGLYKPGEEDDKIIEYEEEFALPATGELNSLENWVHQHANILKGNRVTHYIPSTIPEEEREEYEGKLTEADPIIERLKGANEDVPLVAPPEGEETGGVPCWVSKIVGDQQ